MPFAVTWMDLEIVLLSEVSQTEYDITYMWNLKIWLQINFIHNINRYITYRWNLKKKAADELIYKTEIDPHT